MKCPYCNETLDVELLDNEFSAGAYYDTVLGVCPKCDRRFKWIERFTYDGYDEFEEDKNEY